MQREHGQPLKSSSRGVVPGLSLSDSPSQAAEGSIPGPMTQAALSALLSCLQAWLLSSAHCELQPSSQVSVTCPGGPWVLLWSLILALLNSLTPPS